MQIEQEFIGLSYSSYPKAGSQRAFDYNNAIVGAIVSSLSASVEMTSSNVVDFVISPPPTSSVQYSSFVSSYFSSLHRALQGSTNSFIARYTITVTSSTYSYLSDSFTNAVKSTFIINLHDAALVYNANGLKNVTSTIIISLTDDTSSSSNTPSSGLIFNVPVADEYHLFLQFICIEEEQI